MRVHVLSITILLLGALLIPSVLSGDHGDYQGVVDNGRASNPPPARREAMWGRRRRSDPMPWRTGWQRKMTYRCDQPRGRCWIEQHLPRLPVFDACFDGKVGFGDVDGLVERNGNILMLELKGPDASLKEGQRIAYEQLSRHLGTAYHPVVIWGRPDFTGSLRWQTWHKGQSRGPQATTLAEVRRYFRTWFEWADRSPAAPGLPLPWGQWAAVLFLWSAVLAGGLVWLLIEAGVLQTGGAP